MSRLLPERRALGLFPDQVRLTVGKRQTSASGGDAADWFGAADALLLGRPAAGWLRPRLDVLLSDETAHAVALPWQDGLHTPAQQLRYAEACLEDAGVGAHGWTVQYGYRHHGCAGIAFAVRTEVLDQLAALAAAHRLDLRGVLPATAAAYWRQPLGRKLNALMVLIEARRLTALHFAGRALAAVDVQPVVESQASALLRLLRRMRLQADDVASIRCWSGTQALAVEPVVAECYPGARLGVLPNGRLG